MFEIKFKILDDPAWLRTIPLDQFLYECSNDIRGFLLLNFNGNTFGYLDEDFPPGIDTMDEELLVLWFDLLNDVVKKLVFEKHTYVALKYFENSSTWFTFIVNGKGILIVSLIEDTEKHMGQGRGTIITQPFDTFVYGDWKNAELSLSQFAHEVIKKTKQFINCVEDISPLILQIKNMQELIQHVKDFESYQCHD